MDIHWWLSALKPYFQGAVGGLATLGGQWVLAKIKSGHSRQEEKQKAALANATFVTRQHFETEFSAMKEVFKRLAELRLAMNTVRPPEREFPKPEGPSVISLIADLSTFTSAYNSFVTTVESLRPFYQETLHEALSHCKSAASIELTEVRIQLPPTDRTTWYEEGNRNRREYMLGYLRASTAIRSRISELAILPDT
jgi:hypothetical protein